MALTPEESQKAAKIVGEWFWQPDSWHRKSVVRFYESAPIQPDVLRLVIAYLKTQTATTVNILNKNINLDETWKAKDAWFQTAIAEKWNGTDSTKIRIYQSLAPESDTDGTTILVEDGIQYDVTHTMYWNVEALPEVDPAGNGVTQTLQGIVRDPETGLFSCVVETRTENPVLESTLTFRKTLRSVIKTTTDLNQDEPLDEDDLKIGEARKSEKTPGGKFNNTTEEVVGEPAGELVREQSKSGVVSTSTSTLENVDADDVPEDELPATPNKIVKRKIKRTEENNVDVEEETTEFSEQTAKATSIYATETIVTTVKRHSTPTGNEVAATLGDASAQPDETGAVSSSISEITPHEIDSGWMTWDSTTTTPSGKFKYHHGFRLFKNQPKTWLQSAKPAGGSNVSINAAVNRFGLYDGSMAYTDLYEWDTSGTDYDGGSTGGTITLTEFKTDATGRRWKREVVFTTKIYWGRGNEGAEATACKDEIVYPGLHLRGRTHAIAISSVGGWETDD